MNIGTKNLNSLSWADDLVLMSTYQKGLQSCLNQLYDYCKWGLSVNVKKTKCMIFGKVKLIILCIIIPILTYGSIYLCMSDCFNKNYVSDIPENVSTLENLQN